MRAKNQLLQSISIKIIMLTLFLHYANPIPLPRYRLYM